MKKANGTKVILVTTLALLLTLALLAGACAKPAPAPAPTPAPTPKPAPAPTPTPAPAPVSPVPKARQITQVRYLGAPVGSDNFMLAAFFADAAKPVLGMPTGAFPGGSIENIKLVEKGEAELGYCSLPDLYNAYNGLPPFDKPHKKVRFLARTVDIMIPFAVRMDSDIKAIPDLLKGKKLAVGTKGAMSEIMPMITLEGYGITFEEIAKRGGVVAHLSYSEMATGLVDKTLDCVCIGTPRTKMATSHRPAEERFGVRLLAVDDEALKKTLAKYPAYSRSQVNGGIYKGNPQPVPNVSAVTLQFISSELPDDMVYKIMGVLWSDEMQKKVEKSCPAFDSYLLKYTLDGSTVVPMHPGAAKWYQDKGMTLPAGVKVLP